MKSSAAAARMCSTGSPAAASAAAAMCCVNRSSSGACRLPHLARSQARTLDFNSHFRNRERCRRVVYLVLDRRSSGSKRSGGSGAGSRAGSAPHRALMTGGVAGYAERFGILKSSVSRWAACTPFVRTQSASC